MLSGMFYELLSPEYLPLLFILIALAGVAGFLAGLLGIGGGLVLVPGLFFTFSALGFESDHLMHVAIGTSLATIMATGLSSARAHHLKGAVDINLIKRIAPGLVAGVVFGTYIASSVNSFWLQCFFIPALFVLAVLMLLRPGQKHNLQDGLPRWPVTLPISAGIGVVSSLMGIGGAALNVPFMSLCHVPVHKAIGSAAAMGIFIAIVGTIGFFIIGLEDGIILPPFTYGFINVLALVIIMPVTILMAPLGAAVAHRFSVARLRKIFAVFLFFLCFRMAWDVFQQLSG
jgi:uncharacterized membrane protein YfcA